MLERVCVHVCMRVYVCVCSVGDDLWLWILKRIFKNSITTREPFFQFLLSCPSFPLK